MEIKAQITKKLQKYKADEIKTLYQLMLRVLSGNDDFAWYKMQIQMICVL